MIALWPTTAGGTEWWHHHDERGGAQGTNSRTEDESLLPLCWPFQRPCHMDKQTNGQWYVFHFFGSAPKQQDHQLWKDDGSSVSKVITREEWERVVSGHHAQHWFLGHCLPASHCLVHLICPWNAYIILVWRVFFFALLRPWLMYTIYIYIIIDVNMHISLYAYVSDMDCERLWSSVKTHQFFLKSCLHYGPYIYIYNIIDVYLHISAYVHLSDMGCQQLWSSAE